MNDAETHERFTMFDAMSNLAITNQLLEIVHDAGLRHDLERTLGDYCHQFRNRLNCLKLSIYLAKRQLAPNPPTSWRSLETAYQLLEDQLGRVQLLCRPLELAPVQIDLSLLFEDRRALWSKILAAESQTLEYRQPEGKVVVRFDVNQLGQALDALVVSRAEQGGHSTRAVISWGVESDRAHITWTEWPAAALGPLRLPPSSGSPWTIPILTRVINEHGGKVQVSQNGGWKLELAWPSTCSGC